MLPWVQLAFGHAQSSLAAGGSVPREPEHHTAHLGHANVR